MNQEEHFAFGQPDSKEAVLQNVPPVYENEALGQHHSAYQFPPSHMEEEVPVNQTLYASPPVFHADSVEMKDTNSVSVSSKPTASLVSPPTSLADEMDVVQDGEPMASVEGEAPTLHTPNSSSRHSSRQPPRHFAPEIATSTSTTASSTTVQVQAPAPAPAQVANSTRPPKPSVRTTLPPRRTTPGPHPPKKISSRPSSSHAKKSSPMVEKRFERHATTSLSPHQSKHIHHHMEEEGPDAESLRLIRELQEEEFGLRRRRG